MRRSLTIILLTLATIVTAMAQGVQQESTTEHQPVKTPQSMPTVDQILDRYVQAIGGEKSLRKLTSRITKLTLASEGSDVTYRRLSKAAESSSSSCLMITERLINRVIRRLDNLRYNF